MTKMNINLGAWRRDVKVIGTVSKSREYIVDPAVTYALGLYSVVEVLNEYFTSASANII